MEIIKWTFGIIGMLIILFLVFSGIESYGEYSACNAWSISAERETRFVMSYPWYADCLTKTDSGWISAHKIQQVETPNIKN